MSKKFGVSESFIKAMMQVRGISTEEPGAINESVEEELDEELDEELLDELSKETLKSYIKKAGRQAANHDDSADHMRDVAKTWRAPGNIEKLKKGAAYHTAKSDKRVAGIVKAVKKMTEDMDIELDEELLDELSKKTLASYIDKATTDVHNKAYHAGKKEGQGKGYDADGLVKGIVRMSKINKAAQKLAKEDLDTEYEYMFIDNTGTIVEALDMTYNHVELMFAEGVESISTDNIIVEEIEDLQEVSKETLQSYQKKAQASIDATKKKGKPSKAVVALRAKRGMGLEKVKEKLHAIYKKESEARHAEATKVSAGADKHFDDNHHGILTKHGFQLMSQGKHGDKHIKTYVHAHDNGHVTTVSIHKKDDASHSGLGYRHEVRAVNSKGTSWSAHYPNTGVWDPKEAESHKNEMIPKFENHIIDVKKSGSNHGHW